MHPPQQQQQQQLVLRPVRLLVSKGFSSAEALVLPSVERLVVRVHMKEHMLTSCNLPAQPAARPVTPLQPPLKLIGLQSVVLLLLV